MRAAIAGSLLMLSLLLPWPVESAESAPVDSKVAQAPVDTAAFVGRLISIEEIQPPPCQPSADGHCTTPVSFDTGYEARYRVVQRVSGQLDGDEVHISIHSHRGYPAMALHPHALLFVGQHEGKNFLHRYQGYPVHATKDGGWAHCGDADTRRDDAPSRALRAQDFAVDFGSAAQLAEDADHEKYPLDAFKVENDRIVCPRGIALDDLYELVRNGVMKARGVTLPPMAASNATR